MTSTTLAVALKTSTIDKIQKNGDCITVLMTDKNGQRRTVVCGKRDK